MPHYASLVSCDLYLFNISRVFTLAFENLALAVSISGWHITCHYRKAYIGGAPLRTFLAHFINSNVIDFKYFCVNHICEICVKRIP